MSGILFWDPCCRRPYDTRSVHEEATGGAEGSLSRVADLLGAWVMQHNRSTASGRYLPPGLLPDITQLVVNRDPSLVPVLRELYPRARISLWLHDQILPGSTRARKLARYAPELAKAGARIVCVSDWQRRGVEVSLARLGISQQVSAHTIYNAVEDSVLPDGSGFDPSKLVFFSSPNKGLAFALDAFRALRRAMPELQLIVGNPGYKRARAAAVPGVQYLAPQAQAAMHAHVRGALCTFAPNFVLPETFGLVFAESMALGTPVLAHDAGAASEVISDPAQLLPVPRSCRWYERAVGPLGVRWRAGPAGLAARMGMFDAYVERIHAWRNGARPVVAADPRFRSTVVAQAWRELLSDR